MKALCLVLMTSAAFCLTCSSSEAAGDGCRAGFVWRETIPQDHVCVPPISRQQAREDNVAAEARVNPTNHDYGPDTCVGGFVWREAFRNDHVCVRPEIRTQSAQENALAGSRIYVGPGGPVIVRPVIGVYRGPGQGNGGEYYRDRGRFLVVQGHEHDRRGGEHRGGGDHRGGGHGGGGHGGGGHGGGGHGGGGHGGGGHGGGGHGGGGHGGGGHGGGGHGGGGHGGGGGGKHRH